MNRYGNSIIIGAVVIILAAVSLLVFSPAFSSSFHLDDHDRIVKARLQYSSPRTIIEKYPTRWLVFLTFYGNASLHGNDVTGYHVVNFFIHICNAILVFLLTRILCMHLTRRDPETTEFLQPYWCAVCVAVLFAVHPLQSQAVIYITQRFMLIASFLYLAALYAVARAYLPGNSIKTGWIVACLAILFGLFCKEIIVTAPVLIIAMLWIFIKAPDFSTWRTGRWFVSGIITAILCLLPVLLFLHLCHWDPKQIQDALQSVGGPIDTHTRGLERYTYLITQPSVLMQYMVLFFVPYGFNIDHDVRLCTQWYSPQFLLPVIIFALLFWLGWKTRKTSPFILWGLLVFFITLLPQSSIIPTPDLMFEHRAYLGVAGLIWISAGILNEVYLFIRNRMYSRVILILTVIAALILGIMTFQRSKVWKSELTLWADAYTKSPDKQRVVINYSDALLSIGQTDAVIALIEAKKRKWPIRLPALYSLLGNAYMRKGDAGNAISNYIVSVRHDRGNSDTRYNLAVAYYTQDNTERALHHLGMIMRYDPEYADAYLLRGFILLQNQNQTENARKSLEKYLELLPAGPDAETAKILLSNLSTNVNVRTKDASGNTN